MPPSGLSRAIAAGHDAHGIVAFCECKIRAVLPSYLYGITSPQRVALALSQANRQAFRVREKTINMLLGLTIPVEAWLVS